MNEKHWEKERQPASHIWLEGTNIAIKAIKQGTLTSYCKCILTHIAAQPNYSKLKCQGPHPLFSALSLLATSVLPPPFPLFLLIVSQHVSARQIFFVCVKRRELMDK